MAQYDVKKLSSMSEALQSYARSIEPIIGQLYSISYSCHRALGDKVLVDRNIDQCIQKIADHYIRIAEEAMHIAMDIDREVEEYMETQISGVFPMPGGSDGSDS